MYPLPPCPPLDACDLPLHLRPMSRQCFSVVLVLILWVAAGRAGQDWPEFRGPTGQGDAAAEDLPLEWDATRHIAWKQSIPGHGWSSPVLKGAHVYVTTGVEAGSAG